MTRRQILSLSDRESLLALPEDELTLTRMAYFSEHDLALISAHRKPASRFGFAVLLCYLKNVGFAPDKKIPPSDALLKHIGVRLENGIYGHSRFCNTDFDDKLACLNL
ncbi:DUF4158 domain-containing protein, partial [Enterobacter ludwigii]